MTTCLSLDSDTVITGGADEFVRVWSVAEGKQKVRECDARVSGMLLYVPGVQCVVVCCSVVAVCCGVMQREDASPQCCRASFRPTCTTVCVLLGRVDAAGHTFFLCCLAVLLSWAAQMTIKDFSKRKT